MSETNHEAADYGTVSKIVASRYRKETVAQLTQSPATPSGIAKQTGNKITHCSRALDELREMDVVELLVPEDTQKGRVYALTDEGENAAEAALEVES